ncbi:NAD(P)H-hydrate dehydratase [Helicobacter aurati]|uniref:Bifunctional NAD(P)H-hydrate repair enzyme n=1 Tax=Helicobacter aurati TaxID=137778 RepID=A0A3D8IX12_9HELI|nr:NAD(P)H-hydrate dehydratase [Helicobacter aurati]RDU69817.1 NAD(P)H-hydrate dehydratase [Helicobacter aurati]
MQSIVIHKQTLDQQSCKDFALNEYILMENAGNNFARFIAKQIKKQKNRKSQVVFLCGGGNNGADGLVAARILTALHLESQITIIMLDNPKTALCKAQYDTLRRLNATTHTNPLFNITTFAFLQGELNDATQDNHNTIMSQLLKLQPNDILLDCIFGSGFDNTTRSLQQHAYYKQLQQCFRDSRALKIACDVPSGLPNILGHNADIEDIIGDVDYTLCMGVANLALLDSRIKDVVGKIKILPLGIHQKSYCNSIESDDSQEKTTFMLLEKSDMKLPLRTRQNSNKGTYGTGYILAGEMFGASLLSAKAALHFGVGKVCISQDFIYHTESLQKDCEIIYTNTLPTICNQQATQQAFGIGMGLGYDEAQYSKLFAWLYGLCNLSYPKTARQDSLQLEQNPKKRIATPFVFDADILYRKELINLLPFLEHAVLTPHPKELLAFMQNSCLKSLHQYNSIDSVLRNMPYIAQCLTQAFPNVVFLLKGANTLIAHQNRIYINTQGRANLAKGGSGDILSGMIVSLLAQGYSSLQSAMQASLAHAIASQKALKSYDSYALTPKKLLKIIAKLS